MQTANEWDTHIVVEKCNQKNQLRELYPAGIIPGTAADP